jgi:hypothetical protein
MNMEIQLNPNFKEAEEFPSSKYLLSIQLDSSNPPHEPDGAH